MMDEYGYPLPGSRKFHGYLCVTSPSPLVTHFHYERLIINNFVVSIIIECSATVLESGQIYAKYKIVYFV